MRCKTCGGVKQKTFIPHCLQPVLLCRECRRRRIEAERAAQARATGAVATGDVAGGGDTKTEGDSNP